MRNASGGLTTLFVLLIAFGGFGFLIYQNAQPAAPTRVIIPTQPAPTSNPDALAQVLSAGFGDDSTPLPTIVIPTERFVPPTLPPETPGTQGLRPQDLAGEDLFTLEPFSIAASPTPIPPTPTIPAGDDDADVEVQVAALRPTQEWQPPPLEPPLSMDPLGRDHYIFARPVESNANGYGLFYYPYGSNGTQSLSISNVHHGIDFSNPVGTPIRSVGPGVVVFASSPEEPVYPGSASYGQVVIIEHDYAWEDSILWTLYAHLDQPLVRKGDRVEMGQVIALSGNSGKSSGPHLHFEVRMGSEAPLTYGDTYNPGLWVVPYVGHGTVAGRFTDLRGDFVDDVNVTARNTVNGLYYTTSTYTFSGTINQVNSDPRWQENFVIGDIPAGRYVVVVEYNGRRISEIVEVFEGMTTFVELEPVEPATPQPIPTATEASS